MAGTSAGALIAEIARRGVQDLLEAEVSAWGISRPSSGRHRCGEHLAAGPRDG
jgi:hypothetical protein